MITQTCTTTPEASLLMIHLHEKQDGTSDARKFGTDSPVSGATRSSFGAIIMGARRNAASDKL